MSSYRSANSSLRSVGSHHRRKRSPLEGKAKPRLLLVVNVDSFLLSHRLPIALAARDHGYEVIIAAADTGHSDQIRAYGFAFEPLRLDRRSKHPLKELALLISLVRLYRLFRPDIVHHVTIKPVLYGSLASLAIPRSTVVNAISGLGYMVESAGRMRRNMVLVAYRLLAFRSRLRFIVQNTEHRALLQAIGVPSSNLALIEGSGVDPTVFEPPGVEPDPPVVMLPARVLADKGVREFAAASRLLRDAYPRTSFVLVGASDDDNPTAISRPEIQRWVDEGVIDWWGHRTDMAKVLQQASIVVLPSHHEGFPKVLIEAAATGRPLIATDIAGCRPIVTQDTGVKVPVGDVGELAGAISKLLDDPQGRRRLGSAARQLVLSRFTINRVIEQTLALYGPNPSTESTRKEV